MIISKNLLTKIIKEEVEKVLNEQDKSKLVLKQNISQHLRILKFFREVLRKIDVPEELKNMISQSQKTKTPEFLTQVLNIPDTISVKVSSALQNPIELLQSIVDELIKASTISAQKKLVENLLDEEIVEEKKEEDLPNFARDPEQRLERHIQKMKKKGKIKTPEPVISKD